MQPASETKHIKLLEYTLGGRNFTLRQRDEHGQSNGTTLWLGGQVLCYYLASILEKETDTSNKNDGTAKRRRVIELGSGVGLTALALYSMGWDVCATDIEPVISTVLRPNVLANVDMTNIGSANEATIECKELDWSVPPERWAWRDPLRVTQRSPQDSSQPTDLEREMNSMDGTRRQLGPPFDLIVTADTLYTPSLVEPLLRSLHHLALASMPSNERSNKTGPSGKLKTQLSCPIFVAVERRDPQLMDSTFEACSRVWGFKIERIRSIKIRKSLEKAGLSWERDAEGASAWDGVEIWKMRLPGSALGLS